MSIQGLYFQTIAGALGRKLRNYGVLQRPCDILDPYGPTPLSRAEVTDLFELSPGEPLPFVPDAARDLLHSERLERQSMERIRSALYASDCP